MPQQIKSLRPRHHEIIRMAFLGRNNQEISLAVGITPGAVACVLRSELARAELARLALKAEDNLTNVPLRTQLMAELNGATTEALKLRRSLMNDPSKDVKVRARIGEHFLDRVLFGRAPESEHTESYRDILRAINNKLENAQIVKTIDVEGQDAEESEAPHAKAS